MRSEMGDFATVSDLLVQNSLPPQAVGKQVGEPHEDLVLGRSTSQTLVVTNVENKSFPSLVADRPKISDSVAAQEGLSESPDLARDGESTR